MTFSFEIIDEDVTVGFRNLDLDCVKELSDENVVKEVMDIEFYRYGVYDKIELLGREFMFLKCSKKNVVMLRVK